MTPPERSSRSVSKPAFVSSKQAKISLMFLLTGLFLMLGFCSRARSNAHLAWSFIGVAAFLAGWQYVLFRRSGPKAPALAWEFVPMRSHYVQALLQLIIYVYWAQYWPKVYEEAALIFSQIAFFYMFDALVSWSRGLKWRVGFGPWPIVFSTNLFLWFKDDWFIFQFVTVAIGILAKNFIRWERDGKRTHIFNPSALAMTIVSIVLLVTGSTDHTWGIAIATTQDWPPHIYTVVFVCGLVVQFFFSVTLMTFSAMVAICLVNFIYFQATGVYFFANTNISTAVFLSLHLLITDPATTPRSSFGKIVFGVLYGLGECAAYWGLESLDLPNIYQKLLVVPFLNLLTPALDRWANRGILNKFRRWEMWAGPRKFNLGYMGCWAAMFLVMLHTGYVEAPHPGDTLRFWAQAARENRLTATKYLTRFLGYLDDRNLHADVRDPFMIPLENVGGKPAANRQQALGALCNEAGAIYAEGKAVKADPAKACHFFNEACEFGNPDGCANIAIQYVIFNRPEAEAGTPLALARMEDAAATMTDAQLLYLLGYSYDAGRGHPADKSKARQFYIRSGELGYSEACRRVGLMDLTGQGAPKDHVSAAKWFQKGVETGDAQSCFYLGNLYRDGDGVPKDAQRSKELLEKACSLGIHNACELLQMAEK